MVYKLVSFFRRLLHRMVQPLIIPLSDQHIAFSTATTEALTALSTKLESVESRLQSMHRDLTFQSQHLQELQQSQEHSAEAVEVQIEELQRTRDAWIRGLDQQLSQVREAHTEFQHTRDAWIRGLDQQLSQVREAHTELQRTRDAWIHGLGQQIEQVLTAQKDDRETAQLRLLRLESWRRSMAGEPPKNALPLVSTPSLDTFLLGLMYRNDQQIHASLTDYDGLFSRLREEQQSGAADSGPVLDIGCGRGNLVAHLRELGLATYGVDIDADAVAMAQETGEDVREEDAFSHLVSLPDNSLAAIVAIQVIEHLQFEDVLRLFRLAARKLLPGGFFLAETINPVCLWAASNWYLMDPSHRNPLHPETTKFLMEQGDLAAVQIRMMHPVPEAQKLQPLAPSEPASDWQPVLELINRNIGQLNDFLYGPQDYAAIGYKVEH